MMRPAFKLIALSTLLLLSASTVKADTLSNFIYTRDGNKLTIVGYTGTNLTINVPNTIYGLPVTGIGREAFGVCTSLTNIMIPSSVISIGDQPFGGCTNLTTIAVDPLNSIYSSVDGVLFDKSQTTLIECPEGKTGSYTVPNSVTRIGRDAFYECFSLTNVMIGTNVTTIGEGAFGYSGLTSVTMGNSVTNIGDGAFGYSSLTSITIPTSVTYLGGGLFCFCYSLTNIIIPDSVTTIGGSLGGVSMFELCTNLRSASLSSNVTMIADDMFNGCSSLASFTVGNNVTNISGCAFYKCTSLTNIIIGDSVTSISGGAFGGCSRLATVDIPQSVTNLNGVVFVGCTNLTIITVAPNNPVYSSVNGVLFDKGQTTLIQYPAGLGGNYTIPNSVTGIGTGAFEYCIGLTNVTIPNSVTSIGDYAFAWSSLRRVYFMGPPPSLGGSGVFVFSGATNATIYYLPGMTWWGDPYYGARPTAQWLLSNPLILNTIPSFGVKTNKFGFIISWATNVSVVVEACTNLASPVWQPVQTNQLTTGSASFSDPQWTNYPGRFYRLRSP